MTKRRDWVSVDLDGLAATLSRNGKNFILSELLRNAWDESGVTEVHVVTEKYPGRPLVRLAIADDSPNGFRDLADAYTLFADSYKKIDASKAGRFNCGEKFVLAFCEQATVTSTTGTISFNDSGRVKSSKKSERGTSIDLLIKMTAAEHTELCTFAKTLLAPRGIETTFNGEWLMPRKPVATLTASLTTEMSNGEGILRRKKRDTTVEVLEPRDDEQAMIYELGIPVMPLDCKWHVNVQQKVPLTMERDAVPPSYIREINVLLLNELSAALTADDASQNWVRDGAGNKAAKPEAVTRVMGLRFGKKRVAFDPSDLEANKIAVSEGYTVVHGGSLSKDEWRNVKVYESVRPAGQVTPSPKPFSKDGTPLELIPRERWNPQMIVFAEYAKVLAEELMNVQIAVRFAHDKGWSTTACYGNSELTVNLAKFFLTAQPRININELLLHEFAHQYESDHLSRSFYDAIARLGASLCELAIEQPELLLFKEWSN